MILEQLQQKLNDAQRELDEAVAAKTAAALLEKKASQAWMEASAKLNSLYLEARIRVQKSV